MFYYLRVRIQFVFVVNATGDSSSSLIRLCYCLVHIEASRREMRRLAVKCGLSP